MHPSILGLPSPLWLWIAAAVFGIADGVYLARRGGFPVRRAAAAMLVLSLAILVGAKLLFLVEQAVAPVGTSAAGAAGAAVLLQDGFRIPGGMLLAAGVLPFVCLALRLPALRFADATVPALGTAVFCIRMGCLLAGCCFGQVGAWPLALRFPAGSAVHAWHSGVGLIGPTEPYSAPVYPIQLWFALIGLGLRFAGGHWQRVKRFDGEVLGKFSLGFYASTFLVEFFRGYQLPLNIPLVAAAAAGWLAFLLFVRSPADARADGQT